jgi:surface antigen
MGGVDADVSRCAAALAAQQMGALQGAVIDLQAQVQLDHADIAKLQAELAAAKAPPPAAPSPAPK